jgi:hypothetical protein
MRGMAFGRLGHARLTHPLEAGGTVRQAGRLPSPVASSSTGRVTDLMPFVSYMPLFRSRTLFE